MTLRPTKALLHPLWLASVLLLVTNDHLLKGAGLLPGWFTGKLSDVVGLVVAPVLLAVLIGARRERSLVAAYAAVAVGFAAIQLHPAIAATWDGAFAALGVPWHTTPDWTDLLALPALLVSYKLLRPTMDDARLTRPQRTVATVGGGIGLVACIATSPARIPEPAIITSSLADIEAQAWVHNDSNTNRTVRLRQLRAEIRLDCELLLDADPGALLTDDLFEPAVQWELPSRATVSALEPVRVNTDGCHAVLVEGDTFDSHVLLWEARPAEIVPGTVEPGQSQPWGRFAIPDLDDTDGIAWELRDSATGECLPQSELDRLEWTFSGTDTWRLTAWEASVDGCLSLDLESHSDTDRMYVCMPSELFPFEPGDRLEMDEQFGLDADQLVITGDDDTQLTLVRLWGNATIDGIDMAPMLDLDTCGLRVHDDCGSVSTDALVTVRPDGTTDEVWLTAGDSKTFTSVDDMLRSVHPVRTEHRAVTDASCPTGPIRTGADIHLVVLRQHDSDLPTE